ncbi:hypothetical protein BBJ28_00025023, partial [Nothophytophthora sp. Chile5]
HDPIMKVFAHIAAIAATSASLAVQTATAGFVTTSGTTFEADGSPFYIFGTNAYWASEIQWSETDLATIFDTMGTNDLTVCRTWGFADLTEAGTAPYNIVYQLWDNGNATVNTDDNGLGYFDLVVAAAKAAGVKLVVPLVNNWSDYGGMDVYVQQLGGTYHDDFYTDETIKAAYKSYVETFVTRYADEETIMAWELCNECRCAGSGTLAESGSCTSATINDWMTEMSAYIKTLDSNHLVASGSEGFMNTDSSVYLYSGPSGVDFDLNLAIDSIDYGTYHAYPDSWGIDATEDESWGVQWIQDHAASGVTAGKPVIMEEYGITNESSVLYLAWSDAAYAAETNMQYWQFGVTSLDTTDIGTIFDTDDLFASAIVPAATQFKARGGSSTGSTAATTTPTTTAATSTTTTDAPVTATDAPASTAEDSSVTDAPVAATTAPTATTAAPTTATTSPTVTTSAPAATTATPATTDAPADEATSGKRLDQLRAQFDVDNGVTQMFTEKSSLIPRNGLYTSEELSSGSASAPASTRDVVIRGLPILRDYRMSAMNMIPHAVTAVAFASLAIQAATAGFVTTSGTAFELDGSPFYIFGTNAYWASEIQWVRQHEGLRQSELRP